MGEEQLLGRDAVTDKITRHKSGAVPQITIELARLARCADEQHCSSLVEEVLHLSEDAARVALYIF